jgi:hypothetical protein
MAALRAVPDFVLGSRSGLMSAEALVSPRLLDASEIRGPRRVRVTVRSRLFERLADLQADRPKDARIYLDSDPLARWVDFLFRLAANCGVLRVALAA